MSAQKKPRSLLIAGNWKMNYGPAATEDYFRKFSNETGRLPKNSGMTLLWAVPFVSLERAVSVCKNTPFEIAAQNAHGEKSGAYTGEISASMLLELGVRWSLVGHSERRQLFGETDEMIRKRAEGLLSQGIRVILCIGETLGEREKDQTREVLVRQLDSVFLSAGSGASVALDGTLVVAYEPVWAIGTGKTATPEQAEEAHQIIRKHLWDKFGMEAAARTAILYGGSVTPENASKLLECPNIDGALVGGASLKPETFAKIAEAGVRILG